MRKYIRAHLECNMNSPNPYTAQNECPVRTLQERIVSFGRRAAAEAQQRAHQRQVQRLEQRSELNCPDSRIRAWEKLHGLQLPSDPAHPILDLIAIDTRLTRTQVLDAQGRRKQQESGTAP